ncbi:MAG: bacteriocin [Phycisphaeraceae bacterium]|nr:bacteriocin [Phycisphaeraceae bacterium]
MSKEDVEKLLLAGGADKEIKYRYNQLESKEKFVEAAKGDGYEFTVEELDEVLKEEGLDFTSYGNPRCRSIWLR